MIKDLSRRSTKDIDLEQTAHDQGWETQKSGWPDYLITRNNEVLFVELKGFRESLKPSQIRMFAMLETFGISTMISVEGDFEHLVPWRKYKWAGFTKDDGIMWRLWLMQTMHRERRKVK